MSDQLPDEDFQRIGSSAHRVGSSGDFSEAPPPPPSVPNTSREALRGSERTPVITSPTGSDFAQTVSIHIIADPTIDNQTSFPSSPSTSTDRSQLTQPIFDPANSSAPNADAVPPTQPFCLPPVPDFNQETLYTAAESSQAGNVFSGPSHIHSSFFFCNEHFFTLFTVGL
ncbi:unnamed protein product [Gongylonema pulchrum]|uniref:Uncharacterized protein n=1 Tax=Gongylonema pulchrum TaxID=637853 RepID=A0A183EPS3_9BILA|nr:unnamed protein product [Gongylonema pulchrum]